MGYTNDHCKSPFSSVNLPWHVLSVHYFDNSFGKQNININNSHAASA